jgi:hypothetical protein
MNKQLKIKQPKNKQPQSFVKPLNIQECPGGDKNCT